MNQTGSFNTLADWLPWLESLSPREIVLGLDRVDAVISRLDLRRPELVVNIGGTNGKGSSAALLEALLLGDAGTVGCYTSPHVSRYNERIRINGLPASDELIVSAMQRVESARENEALTYFEFGTLAALVAFDSAGVESWILEVGMGGRLDAVNAIDPDACLMTNVSLDHCAWLGDNIESIAVEKAGIMRIGKPAVFASPGVPKAIRAHAADIGADLRVASEHYRFAMDENNADRWTWQGARTSLQGLQLPAIGGSMQVQNAAGVLAVVEALQFSHLLNTDNVNRAFAGASLEGRFQRLALPKQWILDVAHNGAAAEALADSLQRQIDETRPTGVVAIVGMLADKDVAAFAAPLRGMVSRWIAVSLPGSRGAKASITASKLAAASDRPCLIEPDMRRALRFADDTTADTDLVLVTGSFYLVGPALDWLRHEAEIMQAQ